MLPLARGFALAAVAVCVSLVPAEDRPPRSPTRASNRCSTGKNLDGWANVNCHPGTFFVKDGEIVTTGKPTGFLRSDKQLRKLRAGIRLDARRQNGKGRRTADCSCGAIRCRAVGTPYTRHRSASAHQLRVHEQGTGGRDEPRRPVQYLGAPCTPDRPHPDGMAAVPAERKPREGRRRVEPLQGDRQRRRHQTGSERQGSVRREQESSA